MAQLEYQLPRLTKMWTHLERQAGGGGMGGAGGAVKGMGEKQIEIDKRLLRERIVLLKRKLDKVKTHRQLYRGRRAEATVPVVSIVGYTNAGKSSLLNQLTAAGVIAEDKLFATLDPTTRRLPLPNGKDVLVTDTVGFIQRLPTKLVAAFRATLEEIKDSTLLIHVVDISSPLAGAQVSAVEAVLKDLDVGDIPRITVWNKVDAIDDAAVGMNAIIVGERTTGTTPDGVSSGNDTNGGISLDGGRQVSASQPIISAPDTTGAGENIAEASEEGFQVEAAVKEDPTPAVMTEATDMIGAVGVALDVDADVARMSSADRGDVRGVDGQRSNVEEVLRAAVECGAVAVSAQTG